MIGVVVVLMVFLSRVTGSTITINSPNVLIKGNQKRSEHLQTYFEYKGIPYAKPPLGDLRFKVRLSTKKPQKKSNKV